MNCRLMRATPTLFAALALSLSSGAFAQRGAIDARTFDKLMKAQELAAAGEHQEALEILDQLSDRKRLSSYARAQLWNFYGFIYASQEKYKDALAAYDNVLAEKDTPDGLRLAAKYTKAQLNFQLENYDECIRIMEDWLATADKPTSTAHIMLSQAYYQKNDYDKALQNVDAAIAIDTNDGKPAQENWLRLKAVLHYTDKDYPKTAEVYEQLVRFYPKASYMRQLAGIYSELGKEERRLALYDAVYEMDGLESETELLNLAFMWLGQDVPYKAGRLIETNMQKGAIKETPRIVETLANAWAQANEHKKAIPTLLKAAQQSDKGILYARLAGVYFNAGQYDEAAEAAVKADRKGGLKNPAGNLMLMGMAYFNNKRNEEALQAFRRAKQDAQLFFDAARWETYTLAEIERIRGIEQARIELRERTQEALQKGGEAGVRISE